MEEGKLVVCKVTFGAEPKDYEVWEFVPRYYQDLKFSSAIKRYRMYYSEAVGKIEMYLLCQKYHMSGCVQYEPTNEMMVEREKGE